MRYIFQVAVMLGDLMLIGTSAVGIFLCWNIFPINLVVIILVVKNFKTWQEYGAFEAWNPKVARKFLDNAK